MPIYEYKCERCKVEFETLQRIDDVDLKQKDNCTEDCTLVKQISRTSFRLSGSGWYATDYKKKG